MFDKVLVPVAPDHPETFARAYEAARRLAGDAGRITVLTVVETVPGFAKLYLPENHVEEAQASVMKVLEPELIGVSDVEVDVVDGHPGQTILDYAAKGGFGCIVISSHRPGLTDFFLGSTAARVVRFFKGSVFVLR